MSRLTEYKHINGAIAELLVRRRELELHLEQRGASVDRVSAEIAHLDQIIAGLRQVIGGDSSSPLDEIAEDDPRLTSRGHLVDQVRQVFNKNKEQTLTQQQIRSNLIESGFLPDPDRIRSTLSYLMSTGEVKRIGWGRYLIAGGELRDPSLEYD